MSKSNMYFKPESKGRAHEDPDVHPLQTTRSVVDPSIYGVQKVDGSWYARGSSQLTALYSNRKETNLGFGSVKRSNGKAHEFQFARALGFGPNHEDHPAYTSDLENAAAKFSEDQ